MGGKRDTRAAPAIDSRPMSASTPSTPDDDPPPREPQAPGDDACCGNGCDPCVWDFYEMERERYFEQLRAWKARREAARAGGG